LVDEETSSDDVENSKPDPDVIHAALRKLGNPKRAETIMVGDTPYDAKAAKKARVKTIALLCGGFSEQELLAAGCIAIYKNPAELLKHYENLPLIGNHLKPRKSPRRS
jgi:phosphoglycolate phosphatase-like HAD superfamily hydrolase